MILFAALLALPQDRPVLPTADDASPLLTFSKPRCDAADGEIVVCATGENRFRLERITPRYVEPPLRVQRDLGRGTLSVETEQRGLPGASAPAAMLRFKIPLGRRKK